MSSVGHRQLSSSPIWLDVVVIVGLAIALSILLVGIFIVGKRWHRAMLNRIEEAKQKRRSKDTFRQENGYSWDYVLVFPVRSSDVICNAEQRKFSTKIILDAITEAGLQVRLFYGLDGNKVYCKIRCPLQRLRQEAFRTNYKLLLNDEDLKVCLQRGRKNAWGPVNIPENPIETKISPYSFIYIKYDTDEEMLPLYKRYMSSENNNSSIFRPVDRLKLLMSIFVAKRSEDGCNLDINKLVQDGCVLQAGPLHDHVELRIIEEKWIKLISLPWDQPLNDVKDYFGEKVGVYFLFLGHNASWLLLASVFGFFSWVNVAATQNNPSPDILPYFSGFIVIWSTLFLEFWKRKEKRWAMQWGMVGFQEDEVIRPQFIGVKKPSPVDGQPEYFFPKNKKARLVTISSSVIGILIALVIGVVASTFVLRIALSNFNELNIGGVRFGGVLSSLLNAVTIQVLNSMYQDVAIKLTNYENHRTDTQFEDYLSAKTFAFQFVNSYSTLFYIAFVKPFLQQLDPCYDNCMTELQSVLGTIFLTRLALGNMMEVLLPLVTAYFDPHTQLAEDDDASALSEVEKCFMQPEYHVMLGPFVDYAELAIEFGYATLFVSAYPLAVCIAFISNYVGIRVHAWKLCEQYRRPEPRSCECIGTWYFFLEVMSTISIFTNAGLVAFTSTLSKQYRWSVRVWIFAGMSLILLGVKFLISEVISDETEDVTIQIKRIDFITSKLLHNRKDDTVINESSTAPAFGDFDIRLEDEDII